MNNLPSLEIAVRNAQSLAMMDAVLCSDWAFRFYSFDKAWAPKVMLGSMRNGSGDHFFLLSSRGVGFLKAFCHESPSSVTEIAKWMKRLSVTGSVKNILRKYSKEPALVFEETTLLLEWQDARSPARFLLGGDDAASRLLIRALTANVDEHCRWIEEYYERKIPRHVVEAFLEQEPLTPELVKSANPEMSYEVVGEEADRIGFPVGRR